MNASEPDVAAAKLVISPRTDRLDSRAAADAVGGSLGNGRGPRTALSLACSPSSFRTVLAPVEPLLKPRRKLEFRWTLGWPDTSEGPVEFDLSPKDGASRVLEYDVATETGRGVGSANALSFSVDRPFDVASGVTYSSTRISGTSLRTGVVTLPESRLMSRERERAMFRPLLG